MIAFLMKLSTSLGELTVIWPSSLRGRAVPAARGRREAAGALDVGVHVCRRRRHQVGRHRLHLVVAEDERDLVRRDAGVLEDARHDVRR